jgi:hypothetical protein
MTKRWPAFALGLLVAAVGVYAQPAGEPPPPSAAAVPPTASQTSVAPELSAPPVTPVASAGPGSPVKSRWRSLTSGNLFEITDYGEQLSIRFLESEVVVDDAVEKADVAVNVGSRRQHRPGRCLLQRQGGGTFVGTCKSQTTCTYWRSLAMEWRTHVCDLSRAFGLRVTGAQATGRGEEPASRAHFDCGKCKWSKTEMKEFRWAREEDSAPPTKPSAGMESVSNSGVPAPGGVFAIESTPLGAEVYVDRDFVGTTPIAEYRLTAGKHQVELRKKGFAVWTRQLSVSAGARGSVAAELER